MRWVIEPAAVQVICAAVDERAGGLDAVVATLASAFDKAAQAAGGETAAALAEVVIDPFIDELAALRRSLALVTETTRSVVGFDEAADFPMAAETQRDLRSVLP